MLKQLDAPGIQEGSGMREEPAAVPWITLVGLLSHRYGALTHRLALVTLIFQQSPSPPQPHPWTLVPYQRCAVF